jgi:acetyltransferase-like isoleucine patch superfamily enzyme
VTVEESGIIGTLNWVTATPYGDPTHFALETGRSPSLYVERHAAITSRHMIDCTDRVTIGAFAILAGWRSQILTHAIDFKMGRQTCAPVKIGRYSFVGTRCVLLKGSVLPDKSVLAAGSVLTRAMSEEGTLYGGSPAAALRAIDTQGKYFTREDGFVT